MRKLLYYICYTTVTIYDITIFMCINTYIYVCVLHLSWKQITV